MLLPELLVVTAIEGGLARLSADATQLRRVLWPLQQLDPAQYAQAEAFFSSTAIPVLAGWPMEPPPASLALCAVTLGSDRETSRPIGGDMGESQLFGTDGVTVYEESDYFGSYCQTTVNTTVYSPNMNACIWVAAAVRWALFVQRRPIEDMGLRNQVVSLEDVGPDPRFESQYVFRRNVSLSGMYEAVTEDAYTTFLKHVNVYVSDDRTPLSPFIPPNP